MSGITAVLNTARNALLAQQVAMEVSSQNIANVNTLGYSRQRALLESRATQTAARVKVGYGVGVDSVYQYVDEYTERAIQTKTSALEDYDARAGVLSHLEAIFNETTDQGLSSVMNQFWTAWQDVANNPGSLPERTALIEKAQVLVKQFNSMSSDLNQIRQSMNTNIQSTIAEINTAIEGLAELNEKIVYAESNGTTANDLRDQRRVVLKDLSSLIGVTALEDPNGSVKVLTTDGLLLVDGNESWGFEQDHDEIYYNHVPADVSGRIHGGKMEAWLDLRDETVPQYLANLDELAGTFIAEVNALHTTGYDLSGNTGNTFFEDFLAAPLTPHPGDYSGAASYIRLSDDILNHPEAIAAGGASGDPGDSEMALRILALQTDDTVQVRKWVIEDRGATRSSSLQAKTMDDYYRSLTGDLGILVGENIQDGAFAETALQNLETIRESVSGVNLDEEMTELIKIQRAYEAASKLVSIADEMLQTILEIR
jgi:flagellar hook-associated protein 1 FlgK